MGIGQEGSFKGNVPGVIAGSDDVYERGDLFGATLMVANLKFDGVVRPTLLIGAPGEDGGKGVVHLVAGGTPDGLAFPTGRAVIHAPESATVRFGTSLASLDDNQVFVGAPATRDNNGVVWSFVVAGDWAQPVTRELRGGGNDIAAPGANDLFGYALAASGTSLFVGVPGADTLPGNRCNQGQIERIDLSATGAIEVMKPLGKQAFGVALGIHPASEPERALVVMSASDAAVDLRAIGK